MEWRNLALRAEVQPQAHLNQEVLLNYTGHKKFRNLGNIELIKLKCDMLTNVQFWAPILCLLVYYLFHPIPSLSSSWKVVQWVFKLTFNSFCRGFLNQHALFWRLEESLKEILNIYLVSSFCDCVCVDMHVFIPRSGDSSVKLVLSFYHVNSEGQTQVLKSKDQEQGPRAPRQHLAGCIWWKGSGFTSVQLFLLSLGKSCGN